MARSYLRENVVFYWIREAHSTSRRHRVRSWKLAVDVARMCPERFRVIRGKKPTTGSKFGIHEVTRSEDDGTTYGRRIFIDAPDGPEIRLPDLPPVPETEET